MAATKVDDKEFFEYLETLRASGVTNMFDAAPHLERKFGLTSDKAEAVLNRWILSYED